MTNGDEGEGPSFRHRQLLIGGDDLIRPLIQRLLHDPSIQPGEGTPDWNHQIVRRGQMQIPVPGLAFSFPGQTSVISDKATKTGDVVTLMTVPSLFGESGQQLGAVKGDVTGR